MLWATLSVISWKSGLKLEIKMQMPCKGFPTSKKTRTPQTVQPLQQQHIYVFIRGPHGRLVLLLNVLPSVNKVYNYYYRMRISFQKH